MKLYVHSLVDKLKDVCYLDDLVTSLLTFEPIVRFREIFNGLIQIVDVYYPHMQHKGDVVMSCADDGPRSCGGAGSSRFVGAPSVQKTKTCGFFGRRFVLLRKSELWGGSSLIIMWGGGDY